MQINSNSNSSKQSNSEQNRTEGINQTKNTDIQLPYPGFIEKNTAGIVFHQSL